MSSARLGVRWTIGDVAPRGFEALRLSIRGVQRLFGDDARYTVVVNSLPIEVARARTGPLLKEISWMAAPTSAPAWLAGRVDPGMADGVAWKLCPLTVHPGLPELALDNDVILWSIPTAVGRWLAEGGVLLAADVKRGFGRFDALCGDVPLNTGIRGTPAGLDLAGELESLLEKRSVRLESELDEQGMQVAALRRLAPLHVVSTEEVSICSPFWPHQKEPGRAGAHFVGLNTRRFGWTYYDRPAEEVRAEHWDRLRGRLEALIG